MIYNNDKIFIFVFKNVDYNKREHLQRYFYVTEIKKIQRILLYIRFQFIILI